MTSLPDIVLVHGFWVTPRSWEHWIERYEAAGYRVLAPAYPGFEVEVEALNADPTQWHYAFTNTFPEDDLMPPSLQQFNAKHYRSDVITEVKEFDGPHLLPAWRNWEEVADYAVSWAVEHAAERSAA